MGDPRDVNRRLAGHLRHLHRTSWGASGLIEFLIYNLPLPVSLTRWPGYVLIGIGQFAVYYVIFRTGGEAEPENAGPGR